MELDVFRTLVAGLVAAITWFVVAGGLYMNPLVARLYKDAASSPALKRWVSVRKYLGFHFLGTCAQCLLWAFVFAVVQPTLGAGWLQQGLGFGLVLIVIKVFPRLFDMWIQSTYPGRLLAVEFVNGALGSFIIGVVLAFVSQ